MESINQAELSVFKKINLVYQEVTNVEKTATVGYGNNSYTAVEHDEVTSILKESITKHGLICIPNVTECEVEYQTYKSKNGNAERFVVRNWVELKVIDIESGGFVSTKAFAMAFDSQDKAPGKAYSMALKYCYLKLFMLKSGDKEEHRMEDHKAPVHVEQKRNANGASEGQLSLISNLMAKKKLDKSEIVRTMIKSFDSKKCSKAIELLNSKASLNQYEFEDGLRGIFNN